MKHRAISLGVLAVVFVGMMVLAAGGKPPAKQPPRPPAPESARPDEHEIVELITDPIRSGLFAVHRIRELAAEHGKIDAAVGALEHVARKADEPPVRVAALFVLSEIRAKQGNIPGAMEALALACTPPEHPRGPGHQPPEAHERFRETMQNRMQEMIRPQMQEMMQKRMGERMQGRMGEMMHGGMGGETPHDLEFGEKMQMGRGPRGGPGCGWQGNHPEGPPPPPPAAPHTPPKRSGCDCPMMMRPTGPPADRDAPRRQPHGERPDRETPERDQRRRIEHREHEEREEIPRRRREQAESSEGRIREGMEERIEELARELADELDRQPADEEQDEERAF